MNSSWNTRSVLLFATTTITLLAYPLPVAESMKPSLWEITLKSDVVKNLPSLSTSARAQMRRFGITPIPLSTSLPLPRGWPCRVRSAVIQAMETLGS